MKKILFITSFLLCKLTYSQSIFDLFTDPDYKRTELSEIENAKNDGYANSTHAKYIGKVIFSEDKIDYNNPDETKFKNEFTNSDFIYLRIYMEKGIQNYPVFNKNGKSFLNEIATVELRISVDGEKPIILVINGKDYLEKTYTTFSFHFFSKKEDYFSGETELLQPLKDRFNGLPLGTHTVSVKVYPYCKKEYTSDRLMAEGEFSYNKMNSELPKEALKTIHSKDFQRGMVDSLLENEIVIAANKHAVKEGWKEKFKLAFINSEEWQPIRAQYTNELLGKRVDAYVYSTWPDGHCSMQLFSFRVDYLGGSEYTKKPYLWGIGDQEDVECIK